MKAFRRAAILAGILSGGGHAIRLKDKRVKGKAESKEKGCSGGKENFEPCSAAAADDRKEVAKENDGKSAKKSATKVATTQSAGIKKSTKKSMKNSVAARAEHQSGMLATANSTLFALHEMAIATKIPGGDLYYDWFGSKSFGGQLIILGMIFTVLSGWRVYITRWYETGITEKPTWAVHDNEKIYKCLGMMEWLASCMFCLCPNKNSISQKVAIFLLSVVNEVAWQELLIRVSRYDVEKFKELLDDDQSEKEKYEKFLRDIEAKKRMMQA